MKTSKWILLLKLISVVSVLILLTPVFISAQDDADDIVFTKNQNPVLSSELLPGFHLDSSEIHSQKSTGERMIVEEWSSDPPDNTTMKIRLYPLKDQKQAIQAAKEIFCATSDGVPGNPYQGSYTGSSIGDKCWFYKNTPDHSKALIFIKGNKLVYVNFYSRNRAISGSFADDVAKKIESSIK